MEGVGTGGSREKSAERACQGRKRDSCFVLIWFWCFRLGLFPEVRRPTLSAASFPGAESQLKKSSPRVCNPEAVSSPQVKQEKLSE